MLHHTSGRRGLHDIVRRYVDIDKAPVNAQVTVSWCMCIICMHNNNMGLGINPVDTMEEHDGKKDREHMFLTPHGRYIYV